MNRPETLTERRQAWKDRQWNREHNIPTRKIILQMQNTELKKQLAELNK